MSPAPTIPVLDNAKPAWNTASQAMSWFTKLVTSAYAWSDLIIKMRQNRANIQYKKKKAEEMAAEIMKEHQKKLAAKNAVEKRAVSEEMDEFVKWVQQRL
jgi:uncharacterized protein involved in tolerance to divalent cations